MMSNDFNTIRDVIHYLSDGGKVVYYDTWILYMQEDGVILSQKEGEWLIDRLLASEFKKWRED